MSTERMVRWGPVAGVLLFLALAPLLGDFYVSAVLTKALWLGLAAASLVFLAAYAGMVSLAQIALFGVAGFTMANLVAADGGSDIEWNPWLAALVAILAATAIGLVFGAISSRSYGIYFLMITLAFAVLAFFFFGQVTQFSGFGGINNVDTPDVIGNPVKEPYRLFYIAFATSVVLFALMYYLTRTPFGLTLQGIRDDPSRMRALGYNVILHRTVAFGFGAFVAAVAGVLSVWWNTRISPGSVDLARSIDVLVIAVIGGLFRLEGAWIGALVFAVLDNETRGVSLIGERFNTVVGVIFLVIVLISPGGLMGIWESATGYARRRFPTGDLAPTTPLVAAEGSSPPGESAQPH